MKTPKHYRKAWNGGVQPTVDESMTWIRSEIEKTGKCPLCYQMPHHVACVVLDVEREMNRSAPNPAAEGCSGRGRPSCTAAECMYGLGWNLKPKAHSCAFTDPEGSQQ